MRSSTRSSAVRPVAIGLLAFLGVVGPVVASLHPSYLTGDERLWPLTWLAWAPVGYLILVRRPGNGVGRGLLTIGAVMGASFSFGSLAATESMGQSVRVWADLTATVTGVVPWIAIVWLLLAFPTGSYESSTARWVGWVLVGFGCSAIIAFTVSTEPMELTGRPSPLAMPNLQEAASLIADDPGFLFVIGLLVVSLLLMVLRVKRSSGVQRAQFRWLLFGAFLHVGVLGLAQILPDDSPAVLLWIPAGVAIPLAIGTAVLRYRLYEIDRLISRTLSYALVITLLGLAVLGVVALLAAFLPSDDPRVVAVATLAAAALFNPLRRRVQRTVDRGFNRSRFDAERVIAEFASSVRAGLETTELVGDLTVVVDRTMQPASVEVWVRQ